MFDFNKHVITKVFNPLKATATSMMEFTTGELADKGLFRFKKIIEFDYGNRKITRYLMYSNLDDSECVLEAFVGNNGNMETYAYVLADTVPFSEDFLDVAGQRYLTIPSGDEYERCVMPECDDRIDGVKGRARVYDMAADKVEKEFGVWTWDYQREVDGLMEYLSIEMSEDTGLFKIFIGEMIEDIFYKFYQTSNG